MILYNYYYLIQDLYIIKDLMCHLIAYVDRCWPRHFQRGKPFIAEAGFSFSTHFININSLILPASHRNVPLVPPLEPGRWHLADRWLFHELDTSRTHIYPCWTYGQCEPQGGSGRKWACPQSGIEWARWHNNITPAWTRLHFARADCNVLKHPPFHYICRGSRIFPRTLLSMK